MINNITIVQVRSNIELIYFDQSMSGLIFGEIFQVRKPMPFLVLEIANLI